MSPVCNHEAVSIVGGASVRDRQHLLHVRNSLKEVCSGLSFTRVAFWTLVFWYIAIWTWFILRAATSSLIFPGAWCRSAGTAVKDWATQLAKVAAEAALCTLGGGPRCDLSFPIVATPGASQY